jgi:hypothetical protein
MTTISKKLFNYYLKSFFFDLIKFLWVLIPIGYLCYITGNNSVIINLIFVLLIIVLIKSSREFLLNLKIIKEEILEKLNIEIKELILKNVKKRILNEFSFNKLIDKPKQLINRNISRYYITKAYNCRKCKREIGQAEFHISSLAKSNPLKTCFKCMGKSDEFIEELNYIKIFNNKISDFKYQYREYISDETINYNKIYDFKISEITLNDNEIEKIFTEHIKILRKKIFPQF